MHALPGDDDGVVDLRRTDARDVAADYAVVAHTLLNDLTVAQGNILTLLRHGDALEPDMSRVLLDRSAAHLEAVIITVHELARGWAVADRDDHDGAPTSQ